MEELNVKEKWETNIVELEIGATKELGGTRDRVVKVGGQKTLPFLSFEGSTPNKPAVAAGVFDYLPEDLWPLYYENFKDMVKDPFVWVKEIEKAEPDLICVRLLSCHPDVKNNSKEYIRDFIPKLLEVTKLPIIVLGCDHVDKDIEILPIVSELARNEKIVVGMTVKENYRTIALSAIASGHSVIAQSPLDINLAKQLNILINDIGVPLEKVIMHHTTGGLGYGFEYCYSIMERCRIAGLQGDKIMATPIINLVSEESWKTKEGKACIEEEPNWGDPNYRSIIWEYTTAIGYLHAGSDIVVVSHPKTIKEIKKYLNS